MEKLFRSGALIFVFIVAPLYGEAVDAAEGILFEGKFYKKETYKSEKYPPREGASVIETAYILAVDPQTEKVLERHRLPGVAKMLEAKEGKLEIVCKAYPWDAQKDFTINFSEGKFDKPVFYGGYLLVRMQSMRSGWTLVSNFMADLEKREYLPDAKFVSQPETLYDDAPKTLDELETALCRAIERDKTQPWHLFYLGQVFWASERKEKAKEIWSEMFGGEYFAIPYYEYSWMANFFERLGQRDWADRAYEEALKRRKAIPQPIEWTTLVERAINFPPARSAAWASQKGVDLERQYLWLLRAREIAGVCTDAEDFVSAIWAKHFREQGDTERAKQEGEFFKKAQRHPFNILRMSVMADYSLPLVAGSEISLVLITLIIFLGALKDSLVLTQKEPKPPLIKRWFISAIPYKDGLVLCLAFAVFALSAIWSYHSVSNMEIITSAPIGMMDSIGHPSTVQEMENYLAQNDMEEMRFAVAVVNHTAGNTERALELYRGLSQNERAQKNLFALQEGNLIPPEPLTARDIYNGYKRYAIFSPAEAYRSFRVYTMDIITYFVIFLVLIIGIPSLVSLFIPLRIAGYLSFDILSSKWGRRARKFFYFLIPGAFDVRHRSIVRGWLVLTLFLFSVVACFIYFSLGMWFFAPGIISGITLPNMIDAYPLPHQIRAAYPLPHTPEGSSARLLGFDIFWFWFGIKTFVACVAFSLIASLTLHIARFKAIRDLK